MPLYEYECTKCRNRFEVRQRMTEDPITVCPTCGGATRRLLFPAGIIFKGSGWYVTDSRKADTASATSSPGETKDTDTKGTETKGAETKKEAPSTSSTATTPSSTSGTDRGSKSTTGSTTT
ncbi:MAG: FmdB family zinc ribbon protein [Chloroflexota bacterium]